MWGTKRVCFLFPTGVCKCSACSIFQDLQELHTFFQAFVGLVSLFGFLVVVAELMGNTGTPETGFTWSVLFVFLAGAYCYTGFCDALRIPEVDFSNGWYLALEFSAWRAILCTIVCPLLAGAYVVYCRVCCPGRWELVPQLWFLQPGAAIAE